MPSKRANTGKATISPVKRHRAEVAAPVDPLLEAYAPMLKVLLTPGATSEEDDSVAQLLCAALPFALRATEGTEQRHVYQEKLLAVVAGQLSSTVASHAERVSSVEQEAAKLQLDKAQSIAAREEIAVRLAEKVKDRDCAAESSKKQQESVADAQKGVAAAKEKAEAAEMESQAMERDRDDFVAGMTDLWAPLKSSEIPGKQWREREKMLGRLVQKMKISGAGPSLLAALPVALKLKAEARSEFAQATVAQGEELYMKHVEVLRARVEGFGGELATRAAAVAEAQACATAAQEALDAALEADIAAQNLWAEVTNEEAAQEVEVASFAPGLERCERQLAEARAEVASLQGVVDSFEALRPVGAVLKKARGEAEVGTLLATNLPEQALKTDQ